MYIYYEEFSDVTVIALSANGRNTIVERKNKRDWACVELCVNLLKQVPLAERDFNDKTKVWTIIGFRGKVVITNLESMCIQGLFPNSEVKKIKDLEDKAARGALDEIEREDPAKKFKQEEFFYNPVGEADSGLTPAKLCERLAPLLSLTIAELSSASMDEKTLKKHYRVAALKLHPDRNNGDGTKMSELNMLWGIYTSTGG